MSSNVGAGNSMKPQGMDRDGCGKRDHGLGRCPWLLRFSRLESLQCHLASNVCLYNFTHIYIYIMTLMTMILDVFSVGVIWNHLDSILGLG